MAYRLFYWALRGRGEQVRLLLNELEQDYEDVHVVKDADFQRMQREGPGTLDFGSVPMLQDGDFKLVQGPVIMNYLGRKHAIMPSDFQAAAKTEAMVLGAEEQIGISHPPGAVATSRACPAPQRGRVASAVRQGLCSRDRTRKGRSRPKKPMIEPKGPSDPLPPGTQQQSLDSGREKSYSEARIGVS